MMLAGLLLSIFGLPPPVALPCLGYKRGQFVREVLGRSAS